VRDGGQQVQIAQDYYTLKHGGGTTEAYDQFIAKLRGAVGGLRIG